MRGDASEQLGRQVLRASDCNAADDQLARLRLGKGERLAQGGEARNSSRQGAGKHAQVEMAENADRCQVAQRVVGQLLEQRHCQRVRVAQQQQRVPVGARTRHRLGRDDRARARPVFHHHGLAEHLRHRSGNGARRQVGDAPGRERNEQRDRSVREVRLRSRHTGHRARAEHQQRIAARRRGVKLHRRSHLAHSDTELKTLQCRFRFASPRCSVRRAPSSG